MIKKVLTGIEELDKLLDNGLIEGQSILLTGGPGTGKTTLGVQFIVNGIIKYNEPGVILILNDQYDKMIHKIESFGVNSKKVIRSNLLSIIDISPILIRKNDRKYEAKIKSESDLIVGNRDFNILEIISLIHSQKRKINPKRILIDSLMPLVLKYQDPFLFSQELNFLLKTIRYLEITSIIISEKNSFNSEFSFKSHIVDGIIKLSLLRKGDKKIRYLDILKMDDINHSMNSKPFEITNEGIKIIPNQQIFTDEVIKTIY